MTDKEKAKAYDEAVKKAREIAANPNRILQLDDFEELFPGITDESEDEKIRKEIIDYLGLVGKGKGDYAQPMIDRWIAYLEKQKEQKPIEITPNQFDGITYGMKGYSSEKPAEWSEEDDEMLQLLISYFGFPKIPMKINTSDKVVDFKEIASWLKALPERFNLQSKQEWSEEDERMVRFYEADYNNQIGDMSMKDVIDMRLKFKDWLVNRLKYLRPPFKDREMKLKILKYLSTRCSSLEFEEVEDYLNNLCPSWRPSEEQIKALKRCVDGWQDIADGVLESLYNDLKKLT